MNGAILSAMRRERKSSVDDMGMLYENLLDQRVRGRINCRILF